MMGWTTPEAVSSPDFKDGRGGKGFSSCSSLVGDTDLMLAGYTVKPARDEFAWSGGGRSPPDRKEGHNERSSGSEVPPDADGAIWERMAAACETDHGASDKLRVA